MEQLCIVVLLLAGVPCALFLANLRVYRRLALGRGRKPETTRPEDSPRVSILIPARNEGSRIAATLESVLSDPDRRFEVLVANDHSTDQTAEVVQDLASRDHRVRLVEMPQLPVGWCGKQHACHVLAGLATAPILVFMDADVRLKPGAISRLTDCVATSGHHLLSGVPHQLLGSFSERLMIPLIHFVLLCYLPMHWARRSRHPAFAAGCGQLMVADAAAYWKAGGHAAIRSSLHDGLTLPRAFRRAGFRTAMFDATDVAECRMYDTGRAVWPGLAKNATEGLAAPAALLPITALLFGGHILPCLLLAFGSLSATGLGLSVAAIILSLLPRLIAAHRFHQPLAYAFLHPLGIAALLGIQWFAWARSLAGRPSSWKGRQYPSTAPAAASARAGGAI